MGLTIEFEFADGRTTEVHMSYSYFHANSICAGGGKSHFENMREHSMTDHDGEYTGDIVLIMYANCLRKGYLGEVGRLQVAPVKARFM